MFRAAAAAALLGLAAALALPALHVTAATAGHLAAAWWPVVLVAAGVGGLVTPVRFYGSTLPIAVGVFGLLLLAGNVVGAPVGALLWAAALLVLGLRLIIGARGWFRGGQYSWLRRLGLAPPTLRFAGDVHLGGPDWRVENSSTYLYMGELHLDLTRTRLPAGTTPLRIGMFAGEVEVTVPGDVGVRATSRMCAGDMTILGHNSEGLSPHLRVQSDDFEAAERRVDIVVEMWFGELNVRRIG